MDHMQILMALMFLDKGGGAVALQQALPAMMQGPVGTRVAAAVLIARKEQKQQDETHTQIIKELVAAGMVRDVKTLQDRLPALHAVYDRLPSAMRDSIIFPSPDSPRHAEGSRKGERAAA
jgi:hypothetical protein